MKDGHECFVVRGQKSPEDDRRSRGILRGSGALDSYERKSSGNPELFLGQPKSLVPKKGLGFPITLILKDFNDLQIANAYKTAHSAATVYKMCTKSGYLMVRCFSSKRTSTERGMRSIFFLRL